jgi:signal transduction histidine kinase
MSFVTPTSISSKLIALIAILMTATVGILTAYFPSRQIAELRRGLVDKGLMFEALLSQQLAPAIAFRDRATARELLGSLVQDPDLVSAALYTADGRLLHAVGALGTAATPPASVATARSVDVTDEHIIVRSPVVSAEGPRGTLVIDLSTQRLRENRRAVTLTAFAVGGLVLGCGVLAAWLIARSLAARLRRIADAASAVAAGNLDQQEAVADASPDEIGTLARGFNAMLAQLRGLIANIQQMARHEQETLAETNRSLEDRVQERTRQLSTANQQLTREMEERARMEIELRHAQKLESVGRLAAGIAHEINTPIQFVGNNITFLATTFDDLLQLCTTYRQLCDQATSAALTSADLAALDDAESTADLEFARENVPRSIAATQDGIGRVARIVQSMKSFAHPDRGEKTTADINAALNSTITVASNELRYVADVETDLGELPQVPCYLSDLNQVFLNLLVNAAHAIGDVVGTTGRKGKIRITTALDPNHEQVLVSVADTGTGIPVAAREHVFDPFFTTKEVGKGTGQGLALARTVIVDKHHGSITFATELGKGTTFTIALPLLHEAPRPAA